jgi:acyl-CoA thioesterase I
VHGSGAERRARRVARAIRAVGLALSIVGLAACAGPAPTPPGPATPGGPTVSGTPGTSDVPTGSAGQALRYVALGDSYTIGTSVTEPERWPNQLVGALGADRAAIELVANLGVNGFTTADVIAVELPRIEALRPDVITLQIGVNDVVQRVSEATYRDRLGQIFAALRIAAPTARILCVTTPDYTVTPAGADYGDPATQRAAIRRFNEIFTQVSRAQGIAVVDIFDLSEGAATDGTLVARDGLHPSGRQYGLWVDRIAPAVRSLLGSPSP